MRRLLFISQALLICILATSCNSGKLVEPIISPSPTIGSTPTSSPVPIPTLTLTPTLTPSPIPTPIGGSDKLLLGGFHGGSDISIGKPGVFLYSFSSNQLSLILDEYHLEGVSPDGEYLLVSDITYIDQQWADYYIGNLYITDLDGSNPVLLSPNFVQSPRLGNLNAGWFSENDLIFFLALDNQKVQIFSIQPDGIGLSQVTQSTIGVTTFLPNLFKGEIYWNEGSGNITYGWKKTKIDGTETIKLDYFNPSISPNAEYIAYLSESDFQGMGCLWCELSVSMLDTTDTVKISGIDLAENTTGQFPPMMHWFTWFPDSQQILVQLAFCSPDCDTHRSFIVSISGEILGELDIEGIYFGEVGTWSPDGQYFITSQELLDMETMSIEVLDFSSLNLTIITKEYWLPQ